MAEGAGAVKAETINIVVRAQDGSDVQFKIKKSTKMEKVFQAYAAKKALDPKTIRFLADGNTIRSDVSAADAGLENEDVIDAMVAQIGGGGADGRPPRR